MKKKMKLLLDPVANQIIQKIRVNGKLTATQILESGISASRATLYRKLERMLEEDIIEIADTSIIMGQEEKTYRIKEVYITDQSDNNERMKMVTMGLRNIEYQYAEYFEDENADVNRDKLFMMNYHVNLSDEDYKAMLQEMLAVVDKYQTVESEKAKDRNIYLISAPRGDK